MSTLVRVKHKTDIVKFIYPEYLRSAENAGLWSHRNRVTSNFVFEFRNFCYNGNEGCSSVNFSDIVKLADNFENHPFGASMWHTSVTHTDLQLIFCQNFSNFSYYGNSGRSNVNFDEPLKCRVQNSPVRYFCHISPVPAKL